jgi:hypothetical protein
VDNSVKKALDNGRRSRNDAILWACSIKWQLIYLLKTMTCTDSFRERRLPAVNADIHAVCGQVKLGKPHEY